MGRSLISIHALLAESDPYHEYEQAHQRTFLSTLSLRRATEPLQGPHVDIRISIHALLAESDNNEGREVVVALPFLSTLSLRRATLWACGQEKSTDISIHALLAESDLPSLRA